MNYFIFVWAIIMVLALVNYEANAKTWENAFHKSESISDDIQQKYEAAEAEVKFAKRSKQTMFARLDAAEARVAELEKDPTPEAILAGARSIGKTMGMENHNDRARHCWLAIRAALEQTDG